jgi:hypothetical protein
MFRPFADTNIIDDMRIDREMETKNATQCAIKAVEILLREIPETETDTRRKVDNPVFLKYQSILNQLKQM